MHIDKENLKSIEKNPKGKTFGVEGRRGSARISQLGNR